MSEYTLESLLDGDGQRNERDDNDDCPFAALGDVRVREDAAGTVRVMLAYGTAPGGLQSIGGGYFVCNTTAPYSELGLGRLRGCGRRWGAGARVAAGSFDLGSVRTGHAAVGFVDEGCRESS